MSTVISSFSVDEMVTYLESKGLPMEVTEAAWENGVDGEVFLELTESNLQEIAPRLADRVKLKKLQQSQGANTSLPHADGFAIHCIPAHVCVMSIVRKNLRQVENHDQ